MLEVIGLLTVTFIGLVVACALAGVLKWKLEIGDKHYGNLE